MTASDDVDTVFVAREDSSVSNQRGTHTNTELWIQILILLFYDIFHIFVYLLFCFSIHKRLPMSLKDLFDYEIQSLRNS